MTDGTQRGPDFGEGLYRLLVETVQDYAIFALDPLGFVLNWNTGAERVKGYLPSEIIGQHFSRFYSEAEREALKPERELEQAKREGRVEDEGWRIRKDGSRFWANVVITALRDPAGELVGFAKVTRDLTERHDAEQRAITAANSLSTVEHANQAKADFLAAMSHELRTPLNAISGYSDLLLAGIGGDITAQQRQYLERIKGSQQHLLGIINDILNFSRIEAGHVAYDIRDCSLDAVVRAVLPMIEPQAAARRIALRFFPRPGLMVKADCERTEQILVNLLSNAIKFTDPDGYVEVTCEATASVGRLHVRDSGRGIGRDELVGIFRPFVQVGRSLTNPQEGTGLGLAISSDLAAAMSGSLTVVSEPGIGSTFTLTLPRA